MANVVITDTDKAEWIKMSYNDYYPSQVDHKEQFQRKSDISAVDIILLGDSEAVEIMDSNSVRNYYSNELSSSFFTVDSVNGVAPESITDLRDKILALL